MALTKSLLEMTQSILSAMEDDEVNSISDTTNSLSVALTIKECYEELVTELDLPGNESLLQLEAVSDTDRPNYMRLPDKAKKLNWVKYAGVDVAYLSPRDFVENALRYTTNYVMVEDFNGVDLPVATDHDPTYWTTFDDEYIVFDSIDLDNESSLISNRSIAFVETQPDFTLDDDFVPHLAPSLFPTLLSKAKARCFVDFKQVSNSNAERSERRGLVRHMNDMFRHNRRKPYNRTPDYGKPRR
jgi:hypothetical protein